MSNLRSHHRPGLLLPVLLRSGLRLLPILQDLLWLWVRLRNNPHRRSKHNILERKSPFIFFCFKIFDNMDIIFTVHTERCPVSSLFIDILSEELVS